MPLSPEQEATVTKLLNAGTLADDAAFKEPLAIMEPELKAALGADHPMANDTLLLHRFLLARKLQLQPTVEMIEEHIKWREVTLPVQLTPAIMAELRKGKAEAYGTDREGRPLVIVHSGRFDPKTRDLEASVLGLLYLIESAIASLPPGVTQFAVLYDRTDFSLRKNWDYELLKQVFTQLSANYPERLGGAYVYPAGKLFTWLWSLVKHFVDPRSRAKVRALNTTAELLEVISPEFVPVGAGGTSTHEFDSSQFDKLAAGVD